MTFHIFDTLGDGLISSGNCSVGFSIFANEIEHVNLSGSQLGEFSEYEYSFAAGCTAADSSPPSLEFLRFSIQALTDSASLYGQACCVIASMRYRENQDRNGGREIGVNYLAATECRSLSVLRYDLSACVRASRQRISFSRIFATIFRYGHLVKLSRLQELRPHWHYAVCSDFI